MNNDLNNHSFMDTLCQSINEKIQDGFGLPISGHTVYMECTSNTIIGYHKRKPIQIRVHTFGRKIIFDEIYKNVCSIPFSRECWQYNRNTPLDSFSEAIARKISYSLHPSRLVKSIKGKTRNFKIIDPRNGYMMVPQPKNPSKKWKEKKAKERKWFKERNFYGIIYDIKRSLRKTPFLIL